jgi:hypothetical protein
MRSSEATVRERVEDFRNKIRDGWVYTELLAFAAQKWGIKSTSTVKGYYSQAKALIAEDGKGEAEEYRAEQINRLKNVIRELRPMIFKETPVLNEEGKPVLVRGKPKMRKVIHDTNYRHYLATLRHLSRITGIEHITIDDPGRLSTDELKAVLDDFYKKLDGDN